MIVSDLAAFLEQHAFGARGEGVVAKARFRACAASPWLIWSDLYPRAGVRPWRRIASPIAARSGGPPAAASRIAATSRK